MTEGTAIDSNVVRRMRMKPTLENCEFKIKQALNAYIDAGDALRTIRDERLYKKDFSSFDAYCKERWGWTRVRADQLIQAAWVADAIEAAEVKTIVGTLPPPRNEAAARELAPLKRKPKQLAEAWARAVEKHGPEVEASQVRRFVREVVPSSAAPPVRPADRTLDEAVTALRRLMDRGHEPGLLRDALDAIDPAGARR